jgi:RNA polymerase sigma-70 factor (ECF subfamily)
MWLEWEDGRISFIRDYRYARYVVDDAKLLVVADGATATDKDAD